jgi:hypothetical protein
LTGPEKDGQEKNKQEKDKQECLSSYLKFASG